MMEVSLVNLDAQLVSEQFVADPYPLLRWLREEDPVHWSDSIGGWVLTRYDDIVITFKDVSHYSNEGRLARAVEHLPAPSRAQLKSFEDHYRTKGLLHSDPPDHLRLRILVTQAFTPKMVDALRPLIYTTVDQLLDRGLRDGGMDIIADLAVALPMTVLAQILGAPVSDGMLFKNWADDLLAFQGVNKPGEKILLNSQRALLEIREYLTTLLHKVRQNPGEDLLSQLVAAQDQGDKLSEAELINTCITLLVAGHETTTSLIGNGIYTLLRHPDQWLLLTRERSLLSSALEEILRYESPVSRQPRLIKQDITLAGKEIREGQMLFQMLNTANRDPAYFSDPDRFDIRRTKNPHLAFGRGIHSCVGAALARTEGQIVFQRFVERAPEMRLVDEKPNWDVHKPNSRMLKTLPVTF